MKVQGETPRGVSVAKTIDDTTRLTFELLQKAVADGKTVEELDADIEAAKSKQFGDKKPYKPLLPMWRASQLLRSYRDAMDVSSEIEAIDAEIKELRQQNRELWRLRVEANRQGAPAEAKKMQNGIDLNKEIIEALRDERLERRCV